MKSYKILIIIFLILATSLFVFPLMSSLLPSYGEENLFKQIINILILLIFFVPLMHAAPAILVVGWIDERIRQVLNPLNPNEFCVDGCPHTIFFYPILLIILFIIALIISNIVKIIKLKKVSKRGIFYLLMGWFVVYFVILTFLLVVNYAIRP